MNKQYKLLLLLLLLLVTFRVTILKHWEPFAVGLLTQLLLVHKNAF